MTESRRLSALMSQPPAPGTVVALDANQTVTWDDLEQRVAAWRAQLLRHDGKTFGVFLEDAFEFAAVLLALWQAGKTALLAGDCLPATVSALEGVVDGVVGSFPDSARVPQVAAPRSVASQPRPAFRSLDREHLAVIIFTSGSTGAPKQVPVLLKQLEDELQMHESLWGPQADKALVVGTVSHQHVYGLIWRVLWPLTGGRPFVRHRCHYLEDVISWTGTWPSLVLVTTPSHLARLPETIDWQAQAGCWKQVFSSTAPLVKAHSLAASERLGSPITEIFGSSETGGIAWRRQSEDEIWQCLPGIEVDRNSEDGALRLNSPLLGPGQWMTTGDSVELISPTRFRLLGRIDRVAKIEGKRVSLSAMEQQLDSHPWVELAKVLVLTGRRTETAVVACLSEAGQTVLVSEGKRALCRRLRESLGAQFEPPVLPRKWRFVSVMPRNSQGKIPMHSLQALFAADLAPAVNMLPEVLASERLNAECVQLVIQPNAAGDYFKGHFPGIPILPGVVQVHWAEHFGREFFADRLPQRSAFVQLEAIKFQQVVGPGEKMTLELTLQAGTSKLRFRFFSADHQFSSGRLVFSCMGEEE